MEKNWAQKYICEEKMTNMMSEFSLSDRFHNAGVSMPFLQMLDASLRLRVIDSFKYCGKCSENSSKFKNSVAWAIFTTNCEKESDRKRENVDLLKIFCLQPQKKSNINFDFPHMPLN